MLVVVVVVVCVWGGGVRARVCVHACVRACVRACVCVCVCQTPSTGLRHPSLEEGAGKRCSERVCTATRGVSLCVLRQMVGLSVCMCEPGASVSGLCNIYMLINQGMRPPESAGCVCVEGGGAGGGGSASLLLLFM